MWGMSKVKACQSHVNQVDLMSLKMIHCPNKRWELDLYNLDHFQSHVPISLTSLYDLVQLYECVCSESQVFIFLFGEWRMIYLGWWPSISPRKSAFISFDCSPHFTYVQSSSFSTPSSCRFLLLRLDNVGRSLGSHRILVMAARVEGDKKEVTKCRSNDAFVFNLVP